jgi:lipopolysaccharide transport system ATP-binding protein
MKPIIRVESLSKKYRIGAKKASYGTLKDRLVEIARSPIERFQRNGNAEEQTIWALRDVSFEVQPGEVVGIIGKNGAGKSTLLKILSRVTDPTTGSVDIFGRVGSLLEVGTGFHGELSGRDNILLNGAILGMKRAEIAGKLDEIVEFSGVERYIDTPVKRYSSGMYLRLAFAVAAHLEPEILIIDEVLAVGDAEFQKRCIEKLDQVSHDHGRTVLFVSHNMGSMARLCRNGMLLRAGGISEAGPMSTVIERYLLGMVDPDQNGITGRTADRDVFFSSISTCDAQLNAKSTFSHDEAIVIEVECAVRQWVRGTVMGFFISDSRGRRIFTSNDPHWERLDSVPGKVFSQVRIPANFLVPGTYRLTFAITLYHSQTVDSLENVAEFTIQDMGGEFSLYDGFDYGCVFANCDWSTETRSE